LLGPAPNVNAILILARTGAIPDIEKHRLQLIGYRDKVAALISVLEGAPDTPGNSCTPSTRHAVLVPSAA
jgi:hypothetical protein